MHVGETLMKSWLSFRIPHSAFRIGGFRIGTLLLVTVGSGCDPSDADRLARVGRKAADKVAALVPDRTPFGTPLSLSTAGELENRVKERFRSDVFLAPIQFELSVEGVNVRIKGMVDDEILKRRAMEIAQTTVGVEKVVDEIVVGK
jgi:hypothetical protein